MEKTRPNWQNYFVAVVLAVALLVGAFYGKVIIGNLEVGLFLGYLEIGGACGVIISGLLLLLVKNPAALAGVCTACLVGWLCIGGYDEVVSALLGCGCVTCVATIPFAARLLSRNMGQ